MEMRLPALFSLSTNTVDINRSSDSDSSRTMDSYDSAPQSPSDAGHMFSLKETMRKWLNEVMEDQDQLKEAVSQDKADEFTLLFKTNPLARPCSVDDFRYWIAGGPKSAWNKGASYVFVEILEKRKLIATPDVQTRDGIRKAFLLRLKTLHASWMERQKMQEDHKNPRSLFSKRWQRKNTLFHRRREVIITFHSLESFLLFFNELGVAGMNVL
ncbi:hypothetical protein F5876DRAFT_83117 [Lentinula aff. lateritia]|uniref:Uncharacterized protein n=1 Tax=Lentinula aff. lateritia TaxID=2804960 RepID=A0ACC1TIF9_9AGAR|nr:hypothetical protein F5876DRAFT_83117 [Lentinula aff. lateritia]